MDNPDATPIAYSALEQGTPMLSSSGAEFGVVEHVLELPAEDLFDGIVVKTHDGLRFVDRDQIGEITDRYVTCELTDEQVHALPKPEGQESYHADAFQDEGHSLHDYFGRMFLRRGWKQD